MVVFHHSIRTRLLQQLQAGTQPQSLLLAGPRGVGKRTFARWYVQALLCEAAVRMKPCGHCAACTAVAAGSHPDVTVVPHDSATISIEAFRVLQEKLARTPLCGMQSVIVIPESERLSLAAQHACLKTLEEPRSASSLVLTTSSPEALLPTMRSRLIQVNLNPVPATLLAQALSEADTALTQGERAALAASAHGLPGKIMQDGQTRTDARRQLALAPRMVALLGMPFWRVTQAVREMIDEEKECADQRMDQLFEIGIRQSLRMPRSAQARKLWVECIAARAHAVNNNLALDALSLAIAQT